MVALQVFYEIFMSFWGYSSPCFVKKIFEKKEKLCWTSNM
jgi:hypothetical protein